MLTTASQTLLSRPRTVPGRPDFKAAVTSAAMLPFALAAPALALVDEHGDVLLGEGRGLPLGFDDTMVAMHTFGMFFAVWAFWAVSAKNFGGGATEEDGLSL